MSEAPKRRWLRFSVWENPFIRHGIKIGLGIDSRDKLQLKHAGIDDDEKQLLDEMLA